jgi:hypothetical protein
VVVEIGVGFSVAARLTLAGWRAVLSMMIASQDLRFATAGSARCSSAATRTASKHERHKAVGDRVTMLPHVPKPGAGDTGPRGVRIADGGYDSPITPQCMPVDKIRIGTPQLAYQFAPNSYTYGALAQIELILVRLAIAIIDVIPLARRLEIGAPGGSDQ